MRVVALALPGVEEGTSYGTPAFKVGGKLIARLHQDGEALVVRVDPEARGLLLLSDPETFFITDHYVGHPWVLVRLLRVEPAALRIVLEEAWRSVAPKRFLCRGNKAAPDQPGPMPGTRRQPGKASSSGVRRRGVRRPAGK